MKERHLQRESLIGKVIDVHSHAGVSLKAYANMEYPYAQTLEGLARQQTCGGVDVNVVFPVSADLYFDYLPLTRGDLVPAIEPVSSAPYATENRTIMHNLFNRCPELASRFLPFVSVDPGRAVAGQLNELRSLEREFPIYGIKISGVSCQSCVTGLLDEAVALLDFAEERDLPLLFHVTPLPDDKYSQAADVFRIIESRPQLRFCLAHCIQFHREPLERADATPNVWVDTAALKIQVQVIRQEAGKTIPTSDLVAADYLDHRQVMNVLCRKYPGTMIWGTDSPYYAFMCRRKQGFHGEVREFSLKGTYEDEIAALNALPEDLRLRVSNTNTLDFVFGRRPRR